jgi:hypothetical protein
LRDNDYITDEDLVEQIWRFVEQRELVVEIRDSSDRDSGAEMRFHGVLLHLEVEFENADTGEKRILVQTVAHAIPASEEEQVLHDARKTFNFERRNSIESQASQTTMPQPIGSGSFPQKLQGGASGGRRSSFSGTSQGRRAQSPLVIDKNDELDMADAVKVEDATILTILCCHHEPWANAVLRYCQEVFLLSEDASKELVKGCQKSKDTCIYESGHAPTICHHHYAAIGDQVPLEYNTLHLRIVISDPESPLFAPLIQPKPKLKTHEAGYLRGFGGLMTTAKGTIIREWVWMNRGDAVRMGVTGMKNVGNKMRLSWATQRVDGLLLGIECSAPLKDDAFGNSHSVDAKSKEVSAFGKRKWRDYRRGEEEVPADLGGTTVTLNIHKFNYLQAVAEAVELCKPSDGCIREGRAQEKMELERHLFQGLLQAPDSEWDQIIQDFLALKERMDPGTESMSLKMQGQMSVVKESCDV